MMAHLEDAAIEPAAGRPQPAAGLGTGIGPALTLAYLPVRLGRRSPAAFLAFGGGVQLLFAALPRGLLGIALVTVARTAGGATWACSTVLLQARTADRCRGRSDERLAVNLCNAVAVLAASALLESGAIDLRSAIGACALLQTALAVGYYRLLRSTPGA